MVSSVKKLSNGYVSFDLDGTLAEYNTWIDEFHIGKPIKAMVDRATSYLNNGIEIRIFTARVSGLNSEQIATHIQDWCEQQGLGRPKVVAHKDYKMVYCYDDRAKQVQPNTGLVYEDVLNYLLCDPYILEKFNAFTG